MLYLRVIFKEEMYDGKEKKVGKLKLSLSWSS